MITLFLGENTAERDKAYKAYTQKFVQTYGDMAVDFINTEDVTFGDIINAVTTVPFLSAKRMVIIKYLSGNKDLADKLEQIISRTSQTTDLVFVETTMDNRSIYAKSIKKLADEVAEFDSLDGPVLNGWLVTETESLGGQISRSTAQHLIDRVGHNQQTLISEVKKLILIDSTINEALIDEMTSASPRSSVFNMLDSLMQGKVDVASRLYDEQRAQGMEPQAILGMITWQLFALATVVASDGDSPDVVAKRAKMSPFVVRKNIGLASKLNKSKMSVILELAIVADNNIKTGQAKANDEVHNLLLELAAQTSAA